MRIIALAGASLLVMGCASRGDFQGRADGAASPPGSVQAAILHGEELNQIYIGRGGSLRSNRKWMGLGILAANTFVTAAAGLEAHADSIFAGALVGSTLRSLDPVLNAGGPDAWNAAHGRNLCVMAVASSLNTDVFLTDQNLLVGYANSEEHGSAIARQLARLNAYPGKLLSAMDQIYGRYLHATTPDLPDVNPAAVSALESRSDKINALAFDGVDDPSAALVRFQAALDYADTELPKCLPGQLVESEAETAD
jgi:hypothetical protein